MTILLTSAQMRAAEAEAIANGSVTGASMMECAGQGVVRAVLDEWPEVLIKATSESASARAVVLCGPGNNGGDGFVIARVLVQQGWQVDLFLWGDPAQMRGDAAGMRDQWAGMGAIHPLDDLERRLKLEPPDLIVDALFGTGLTRPVTGAVAQALIGIQNWQQGHGQAARVVAVDLPSGLCADSGRVLGFALPADLTVTFHRAKCGQYLADGPQHCGRIACIDIGVPDPSRHPNGTPGPATRQVLPSAAPWLDKGHGHKFDHGHAVILSGGVGRGGAARLAARAALRIGAGLVTVGCPPSALIENAARLDAVMLRPIRDAADLAMMLADERISALCLGPGFGTGPREVDLLATALDAAPRAVPGLTGQHRLALCLDADALTLLAGRSDLRERLHDRCVLTPHSGEFARMFPDLADRLSAHPTKGPAYSKLDAVRAAAAKFGCTVLLKGADTVIANPNGDCALHAASYDRAAPWLATAGSGDVLAGFITGLMARGRPPIQAAEVGTMLHTECARHFGPGLIAEDLSEQLPAVLRALCDQSL